MELNLDTTGNLLAISRTDITRLDNLVVDQGNRGIPLSVWLLRRTGNQSAPFQVLALPAPYTKIILVCRFLNDLTEADLLFSVLAFTATGTGDTLHYQGALSADTAAVRAKFTAAGVKSKTVDALADVLFSNDDASVQEVIIRQQKCTIYRKMYLGTEGTTPSDPVYPLPGALALRTVAGRYRIKDDGSFQLWNGTQSKWQTLSLTGAAGAELPHIGAGED